MGAQSKERKGSNFAIWQPWTKASLLGLTTSALSASEAEWEEDSLDGRNHIGRSNGGVGNRNGRARVGFSDYTSVS